MKRAFYSESLKNFLTEDNNLILGKLATNSGCNLDQSHAWQEQVTVLKNTLQGFEGRILFEYIIPRMGKRVDVVLLIQDSIFVIEFKSGEYNYQFSDVIQVWDYVLDLKNFHEYCDKPLIAPVLCATNAPDTEISIEESIHNDHTIKPLKTNKYKLREVIESIIDWNPYSLSYDINTWEYGRYFPTPTIIEKASKLYCNNAVANIAEKSSDEATFTNTTLKISEIIEHTRNNKEKAICFVTGVPGAGKTLVGLEIAAKHLDADRRESSVYLSGNGPLVKVLQEALALDHIATLKKENQIITKTEARSKVKLFIQNVHHFRDACLLDLRPQPEHIAIFDEAQRAWNFKQTVDFMKRKKNKDDFSVSEPEFLISCMDRHPDWSVILCLVGGGQEINIGEAGISEWIDAINRSFDNWRVYISEQLNDKEYAAGEALSLFNNQNNITKLKDLHLAVSMRSFRAEMISDFVKQLLDLRQLEASSMYKKFQLKYPLVITRNLRKAKSWLKLMARGSQRYGIVTSSKAQRLKPLAIDVRYETNPIHWFLHDRDDVRSSFYLEDVATEFQVQGLELDWVCHVWDADFRYSENGWIHKNFRGKKWVNIRSLENQAYQKNAYRVLLTRARQGMIICIPEGDINDSTRNPEYYNCTYKYLKSIGIQEI